MVKDVMSLCKDMYIIRAMPLCSFNLASCALNVGLDSVARFGPMPTGHSPKSEQQDSWWYLMILMIPVCCDLVRLRWAYHGWPRAWDACQVDMGCWPDHGQRNRHFTTSWAQINWHRDIMVWFDRFVQTLGLWPSLAITGRPGFCGASNLRWEWWGFRDLAMSPCDTAGLNWTPKLQTSYFFDSEGMREKMF